MENATSLQLGIDAFNAGKKDEARFYLLKAVREEPNSERAWGWLSNTAITTDERIHCLKQVIRINPQNGPTKTLLQDLEVNDWTRVSNRPGTAANVQTTQEVAPVQITIPSFQTIQTIIVVLLVVMILYWLGIGLLQIMLAFNIVFNNTSAGNLFWFGLFNVGISILNGAMIPPVLGKKKSALQQLYFLAVVGSVFGTFQMVFSTSAIQVCAIPLYITLGILAYVGKDMFVN
jgi:hypothetical protein